MASFIESIGKYREGKEEWSQYAKHPNHSLSANVIEDEKKKDIFLAVIGKSLVTAAKPGKKGI